MHGKVSAVYLYDLKKNILSDGVKKDTVCVISYFTVIEGQTGVPFVDANMRELAMTGFMSNRGRQNVASFLTKDLGLDWRMGAEWFEYLLV